MGELVQARGLRNGLTWVGRIPEARRLHLVFLFLSQTLFLWMFLSSQSLERAADAGQIALPGINETRLLCYRYASEWRHGMTGNWPLYMPGFFLISAATWVWALHRRAARLILEGTSSAAAAGCIAWVLSPTGAARVMRDFENAFGITAQGTLLPPSTAGTAVAFYTLFTWTIGMISSQRALTQRSFLPMLWPVALNLILAHVRPWTVNDFTTLWFRRAAEGDPTAVSSLAAIPVLATLMVLYQFRRLPGLVR